VASKHVAIYTRDEVAGTSHRFFAYSILPVQGEEQRDELLGAFESLEHAITIADKYENER
jgi:hypothetical protein